MEFFLNFLAFFEKAYYNKGMERKMCVLEDNKECDGCMECEICDLDPKKICDNCGKGLDVKEFASIKIDKIYTNPDEYKE